MSTPIYRLSIRDKLIAIFIVIKVVPLVILAWFSWEAVSYLASTVEGQVAEMVSESKDVVEQIGKLSTENSIRALDWLSSLSGRAGYSLQECGRTRLLFCRMSC